MGPVASLMSASCYRCQLQHVACRVAGGETSFLTASLQCLHIRSLLALHLLSCQRRSQGQSWGHCGRHRLHGGGGGGVKNLWPFLIQHTWGLVGSASWACFGPRKKRFCWFFQFSCIMDTFFSSTYELLRNWRYFVWTENWNEGQ